MASQSRRRRSKSSSSSWNASSTNHLDNFSFILGSQIRYLVSNLTKKTYTKSVAELEQLTNLYGQDAYLYLLRCLVEQIDFKDQKGQKDQQRIQLLRTQLQHLNGKPNYASLLLQAFAGMELKEEFLIQFAKLLKLTLAEEIILALGIAQSSEKNIKHEGRRYLRTKLPELAQDVSVLPQPILHNLLYFLRTRDGFSKQCANLIKAIQKQNGSSTLSISLLCSEPEQDYDAKSMDSEARKARMHDLLSDIAGACHPSDLMQDIGYSCCQTTSNLKELLRQFPEIKEVDVAKILAMMTRTRTSLQDEENHSQSNDKHADTAWNVEVLVDTLKEMHPLLDWPLVIKSLDLPDFAIDDQKVLMLILAAYKKATKEPFPYDAVTSKWANSKGQLTFLKYAVLTPIEVLNFGVASSQMNTFMGELPHPNKTGPFTHHWYSTALIERLLDLAECEDFDIVRDIFEYPLEHCPELLLLKLASITPPWGALYSDLCSTLLPLFLANHPNSSFVLHKLWPINRAMVMKGMVDMYLKDSTCLSRLLDVAHDIKALSPILEIRPFSFTIDLAALASRREYLNLEKWLQDRIAEHGVEFIQSCLLFLREKKRLMNGTKGGQPSAPAAIVLSPDTIQVFLSCLQANASLLTAEMAEELEQLQSSLVVPPPKAVPPTPVAQPLQTPQASAASAGPTVNPNEKEVFPPDIEGPANAYFQSVYTGQMSIEEIVNLLKTFKSSKNKREQRIFSCMIHNLFDEYRFFQKYPDKELRITGILFGALIQHQLVAYISLGIALRYVLEALKKPQNTKMFRFGLFALQQFKSRLVEWPQYCSHILQIPHIRQHHPDIYEFIENSLRNAVPTGEAMPPMPAKGTVPAPSNGASSSGSTLGTPADKPGVATSSSNGTGKKPPGPREAEGSGGGGSGAGGGGLPLPTPGTIGTVEQPTTHSPPPSPLRPAGNSMSGGGGSVVTPPSPAKGSGFHMGASLPLETITNAIKQVPPPDEAIKDKIIFVFNNVSKQNMEGKVNELKALLGTSREAWQYLAQHLVVHRASIEPNFHALYLEFLTALKIPKLITMVLSSTYAAIKALLRSPRIVSVAAERTLLKNLGSWLGSITLARNKPLIHKQLALKELILEAYEKGRLLAVIPFAAKILESCAKSKIFAPPNVWVMAIMRLLAEIYHMPDLKLNLKFEIELLCNHLALDLNEIKMSTALVNKPRENSQDFTSPAPVVPPKEPSPPPQPPPGPTDGGTSGPIPRPGSPPQPPPGPIDDAVLVAGPWKISPHIPLFVQQPQLKRFVAVAIDRAIKEVITPVMERSATIASITTRELVLKDFATETDELLRSAAHLMVQNLAGSLAMVTCKEPLRVSIVNHLRPLLQVPESQRALADYAIQVVVTDNLDLACTLIEKATTEKALRETDDALAPAMEARRKHRERTGTNYDPAMFQGRYPAILPEPLRPRPTGLHPHQRRVYEDFATVHARTAKQHAQAGVQQPQAPSQTGQRPIQEPPGQTGGPTLPYVMHQGTINPVHEGRRASTPAVLPSQKSKDLDVSHAMESFKAVLEELDSFVAECPAGALDQLPEDNQILGILKRIAMLLIASASNEDVIVAMTHKIYKRLFSKSDSSLHNDIHMYLLEAAREHSPRLVRDVTEWTLLSDNESRRLQRGMLARLANLALLKASDLDLYMVKKMDNGRNKAGIDFAIFILQKCFLEKEGSLTVADIPHTFEALHKLAQRGAGSEGLLDLLAKCAANRPADKPRSPGKLLTRDEAGMRTPLSAVDDPMVAQTTEWWERWKALYFQPNQTEKVLLAYLAQIQQSILQAEDQGIVKSFLRICTVLAIEQSFVPGLMATVPQLSYKSVDAFAKLIIMLYKISPEGPANANGTKANLLNKVFDTVVRVLLKNYDTRKTKFNQRPFFRLFASLLIDLNAVTPDTDPSHFAVLSAFNNVFMILSPIRVPGFCLAWLELISHRFFMPKLLLSKTPNGWAMFQQLLVELFKYLEPYLVNVELNEPIRLLYKGTLRVLLVLLHDFPEFLCDYHFSFCDVIPPTCIQLRNLILSAFPRNMRLPDPFTPNLKVDLLPEINQSPRILSKYATALTQNKAFKQEIDTYLKTGAPVTVLLELRTKLLLPQGQAFVGSTRYNVPLINALVLYVGMQAIAQLQVGTQGSSPIAQSAPMDIFQHLAMDLDTEGRYLFLNAIANQLRYPNNHTHYFSCVLLYLFAEANQASQEIIQEQITRVLLERLIVNRPHPWGLLITFIELIKNPRYNFWSHSFTRCAPEIERLFESVARSCMGGPVKPERERSGSLDKH